MREISFVKRLNFNFTGGITKKALVLGDADNDKHNELVCASLQGDLAVFKERNSNKYAYATDLGMVTAVIVGDVINENINYIAAINTEGWLFIFHLLCPYKSPTINIPAEFSRDFASTLKASGSDRDNNSNQPIKLSCLYQQRIIANCKELLLADLDGDGDNELIIGLTDRVLRTYKWVKIANSERGKFVGLYKWEFADQIGSISLNPSRHKNCHDIIVAQPGGTYAKLECYKKKLATFDQRNESKPLNPNDQIIKGDMPRSDKNVKTEHVDKLTPEYHQLALIQMRNHHISTEVLGGVRHGKNSDQFSLIVIATLDGTLMLVNRDEILWSLQVDHQLFALALLEYSKSRRSNDLLGQSESTCTIVPNPSAFDDEAHKETPSQYFVVCAWNGKTYIIDEDRNYLRFKFDEAVSAFTAGSFYFDRSEHPALVYATFNNQIRIYYDVIIDHIKPTYLLNEVIDNPSNNDILSDIKKVAAKMNITSNDSASFHKLLYDVLYSIRD